MRQFVELLRASVLVQGMMALICIVTVSLLTLQGRVQSEVLVGVLMVIVGYYFGAKSARA